MELLAAIGRQVQTSPWMQRFHPSSICWQIIWTISACKDFCLWTASITAEGVLERVSRETWVCDNFLFVSSGKEFPDDFGLPTCVVFLCAPRPDSWRQIKTLYNLHGAAWSNKFVRTLLCQSCSLTWQRIILTGVEGWWLQQKPAESGQWLGSPRRSAWSS